LKRIFISRSISHTSPIRNILGKNSIVDQSLIEFSPIAFEQPKADWIFFYSRKGVKYFFENGNYELYPYLWACLSSGTADELSQYVMDISFIGKGAPEDVATAYKEGIKPGSVTCFIRAKSSLDSVNKFIGNKADFSIPVYNNQPISNIPTQEFDIIIFTSPMSVDAWFKERNYKDERIISIGMTTANHLNTYGIKDLIISERPSEEAIAIALNQCL
jgi:uroporphyrinogen-III synthase